MECRHDGISPFGIAAQVGTWTCSGFGFGTSGTRERLVPLSVAWNFRAMAAGPSVAGGNSEATWPRSHSVAGTVQIHPACRRVDLRREWRRARVLGPCARQAGRPPHDEAVTARHPHVCLHGHITQWRGKLHASQIANRMGRLGLALQCLAERETRVHLSRSIPAAAGIRPHLSIRPAAPRLAAHS